MPQKPSWSAQRQVQITAVKLLCSMLSAWNACDARQLSGAVAGSRSLLQSSCPTAGQKSKLLKHIRVNESKFLYSNRSVSADLATTGCSSVSASMLESYRNILLTQCSTVTPVGASGEWSVIAVLLDKLFSPSSLQLRFKLVLDLMLTTSSANTGGCCSALPASGTPGWSTFVDCAW